MFYVGWISVMISLCNLCVLKCVGRASVMIPLCNVDGVASVLFTKRSGTMRAHKNEICFPGGKVTKLEA